MVSLELYNKAYDYHEEICKIIDVLIEQGEQALAKGLYQAIDRAIPALESTELIETAEVAVSQLLDAKILLQQTRWSFGKLVEKGYLDDVARDRLTAQCNELVDLIQQTIDNAKS